MTLPSRHRIRTGRALYLSVTEAHDDTEFYEWIGKTHFCFFQTAKTGKRTPNSSVTDGGANHYPRAPAQRREAVSSSLISPLHEKKGGGPGTVVDPLTAGVAYMRHP